MNVAIWVFQEGGEKTVKCPACRLRLSLQVWHKKDMLARAKFKNNDQKLRVSVFIRKAISA